MGAFVEEQSFFSYIWSALLSVAGLIFGLLHAGHRREMDEVRKMAARAADKAEATQKSLDAHKVHAAETFARKSDAEKGFDKLDEKLDKIDEKLDRIAEAPRH